MSIDPHIPGVASDGRGTAMRLSDLDRRLRNVERTAGQLSENAIQGSMVGADQISTAHLAAGSVTASEIAAGSIYAGAIQAGAVTASTIAANAVTANAIAANSIYAGAIQANAVTATAIAAGAVTATHIAAGTITATQIASGTITATQIASDTITGALIAAGTITAADIAASTITGSLIASGTITATNIAAGTITGSLIAAGTITGSNIVAGTITASLLNVSQLSAITANLGTITAGTITGALMQTAATGARTALGTGIVTSEGTYTGLVGVDGSGAVTFLVNAATGAADFKGTIRSGSSGLGNISGQINGGTAIVVDTITGDRLVVDAITTRELAASSVTATEIAANAVTAGKINAGAVTTATLAAGAVTASAIAAGSIDGMTITGATVRTAASGARVLMDSGGLKQYDASNVLLSHLKTDGTDNVFTGNVQARGVVFPAVSSESAQATASWNRANATTYAALSGWETSAGAYAKLTSYGTLSLNSAVTVQSPDLTSELSVITLKAGNTSATALAEDNAGLSYSSFLRIGGSTSTRMRMQIGSVALTMAAGFWAPTITLPTAWGSAHVAAFASVVPATHYNYTVQISGAPNGLTLVAFIAINNGAAQSCTVYYVSYGY